MPLRHCAQIASPSIAISVSPCMPRGDATPLTVLGASSLQRVVDFALHIICNLLTLLRDIICTVLQLRLKLLQIAYSTSDAQTWFMSARNAAAKVLTR